MVPVMVEARSAPLRLIVCGPLTCCSVARVESGTGPAAVGMRRLNRAAGVSAVPGGSWTRTLTAPEGSTAWAATCPLICCATSPANCCAESPVWPSLSVGTSWYCGLEAVRVRLDSGDSQDPGSGLLKRALDL